MNQKVMAPLFCSAAVLAGCNSRKYNTNVQGVDARFETSGEKGANVFEGFVAIKSASNMVVAGDLYIELGTRDFQDALNEVIAPYVRKYDPNFDPKTFEWDIHVFGINISDFVLVPAKPLKIDNYDAMLASRAFDQGKHKKLKEFTAIFTKDAQKYAQYLGEQAEQQNTFPDTGLLKTSDSEWALKMTNVLKVHEQQKAKGFKPGEGVTIGLIDTGITDHPELLAAGENLLMRKAKNFENGMQDVRNYMNNWSGLHNPSHGTSTATMLISPPGKDNPTETQNQWVTGVSWGSTLIPTKISNSVVIIGGRRMAEAIRYLVDRNVKIISTSMGGIPSKELGDAVDYADKNGVTIFAAAGTAVKFVFWPAHYRKVFAVSSTGVMCQSDPMSARGPSVDFAAPGVGPWFGWALAKDSSGSELIFRTRSGTGTSFSTPIAAGIAALWLASFNQRTSDGRLIPGWNILVDKYGTQNISKLLRYQIKNGQSYRVCGTLAQDGFGPGVIDAQKLINTPLPTVEELRNAQL